MTDIITQINGLSESIKKKIKKVFCKCNNKRKNRGRRARRPPAQPSIPQPPRLENFTNLETGLQSAVSTQNSLIDSQSDELYHQIDTNNQNQAYQQKMFHNLESLNFFLQFIYAILFILTKVLILEQYYNKTVVRDEWIDSIVLTLFFLYPFLIYSVEMYIYQFISTIIGYLYGTTQIPNFDDLFSQTDFYKPPGPDPNDSRDMRNKFN
jgi:hypothetical protein